MRRSCVLIVDFLKEEDVEDVLEEVLDEKMFNFCGGGRGGRVGGVGEECVSFK